MNAEEIREWCLSKPAVEEAFPFDENTLVFKIGGKMFLLLDLLSNPPEFNVKCNPDRAIALREKYSDIRPGYHMNKKHWNTVRCGSLPEKLVKELINNSYELVLASVPKRKKPI